MQNTTITLKKTLKTTDKNTHECLESYKIDVLNKFTLQELLEI